MALMDIVIDTNVLMHANNNEEASQGDCLALINYLLGSTEMLCIDEGLDVDEATNRSRIWYEYMDNLKTHGTTGRTFLEKILQRKRIKEIPIKTEYRITKIINQKIKGTKPVDRIFVRVTCNSESKVLVSHDQEDFKNDKRDFFKSELQIYIIEAQELV